MTEAEVMDISREAIIVTIKIAGPVMLVGLVVGIIVSMVQTVTQIQEATLAYVPKILVVFLSTLLLLPFMLSVMRQFMAGLGDQIIKIGSGT